MFGKMESECMPTRKPWDHTIELKERFILRKEKYIHYQEKRRKKYKHSWKISYEKDTSGH